MADKPVAAGKSSFDLIDQDKVLAILAVRPDSSFLDLACGTGRYSVAIAKHLGAEGQVYAVDLWPEGIESLNNEIAASNIRNIKTLLADISQKLPLAADSIDVCLLATIVHDLSGKKQNLVIQEVFRLLKPGGHLNVIEFKKIDEGPGPPVAIRIDEQELDVLICQYGFAKVAAGEVGEFNYLGKYKKITRQ